MEPISTSETTNQRKSTRFIRKDIKASIVKHSILGLKETINCSLIDVSSTGIQISTPLKLGTNIKLTVYLNFDTGKTFELKARIMRHQVTTNYLSVHSFPKIKHLLHNKGISLHKLYLYESNKQNESIKQIPAKFRNFHASSVKILTHTPLDTKKQYSLIFILSNGDKYNTLTQINDYQQHKCNNYGIKFNKASDELGDYILETQTDLVFK